MKPRPPRHTKIRQTTVSGGAPAEVFSTARPMKPPAKAIHARTAAALRTGGGKLTPKVRKRMDAERSARRTKLADSGPAGPRTTGLRAGKRTPRRAKKPNPGT